MAGQKSNRQNKAPLGRTVDRPYWILVLSLIIRAVHQVGAAVFLAAFLLKGIDAIPMLYLILAAATGGLLLLTEGLRHRQIFREVSGISTMIKIFILWVAHNAWIPAIPAVLFVFLMASIFSHAPKNIRHRLLF